MGQRLVDIAHPHMNLTGHLVRTLRITDGVINQIAHHLTQQKGVTEHRCPRRRGFKIQFQVFLGGR